MEKPGKTEVEYLKDRIQELEDELAGIYGEMISEKNDAKKTDEAIPGN